MDTIAANLQAVRGRITQAAQACGRNPMDIGIIAVTKSFNAATVAAAYAAHQYVFGESYVQEALVKIEALRKLVLEKASDVPLRDVVWHFIGPIQSNKTSQIAEHFSWVHSVDSEKIARRLAAGRPSGLPPLQLCIQVNIGAEQTKRGVAPKELLALARSIAQFPQLKLRGLMAVPPFTAEYAQQQRHFGQLRQLKDELVASGIALDTLSMGMSDDFEAAIAEGATLVRIGTAIFGKRQS